MTEFEDRLRRSGVNLNGWHFTQTLLGGSPDVNARTLCFRGSEVHTFKAGPQGWPMGGDGHLAEICRRLNELQERIAPHDQD